jgi:transposase-like protein
VTGAGKYKTFSPEFGEEAARMVVETSRPIAEVARELGISETSLGDWVRACRKKHAEDEPPLRRIEARGSLDSPGARVTVNGAPTYASAAGPDRHVTGPRW